jgi:hypothetical protein
MIANVFALNSEIIEVPNLFYSNTNKIETYREFELELTNKYQDKLALSYESEYCVLELPEYIESEKITIKGFCEKSDDIIIYGNKHKIKIKVNIIEIEEPPVIPDEPIITPKQGGGRSLTQEGITRYGKNNFYLILDKISIYSKEHKVMGFYWLNTKTYDITYLDYINNDGHKVYKILETIKLE